MNGVFNLTKNEWENATSATFGNTPVKEIVTTSGDKTCSGYVGAGMIVFNDGTDDITVVVNGLSFVVIGGTTYSTTTGEVMEINAGTFSAYSISATTSFRCYVRGI